MNFIAKYWAKAGGVIAIIIFAYLLSSSSFDLQDINTIALLNLSFLMIHQFEEYVYPGGFKEFFNTYVAGITKVIAYPLSNKAIILVNVVIGWGLYSLAAIFPLPVFAMVVLSVSLINGIVHTAALLRLKKYNPGFISGLLLFIPFSLYSSIQILRSSSFNSFDWLLMIILTILGTALIPFTIYIARDNT